MKIISWNVQGAKKMQVVQEAKFLIRTQKADMLFLLETMVNDSNINKILPLLGLNIMIMFHQLITLEALLSFGIVTIFIHQF